MHIEFMTACALAGIADWSGMLVAIAQRRGMDAKAVGDAARTTQVIMALAGRSPPAVIGAPEGAPTVDPNGIGPLKLHPCISQYGHCRYGSRCAFKDLPSDTCLNYVQGSCIYGEGCRNRHALEGVDLRKWMQGSLDGVVRVGDYTLTHLPEGVSADAIQGVVQDPNDPSAMLVLHGTGKVLQTTRVVAVDASGNPIAAAAEVAPKPLPEASAFNTEGRGAAPSYSEPLLPSDFGGAGAFGDSGAGAVGAAPAQPAPFLEKLKAGIAAEAAAKQQGGGGGGAGSGSSKRTPHTTPKATFAPAPQLVVASSSGGAGSGSSVPRPAKVKRHPCVVQCGTCRFGSSCAHADVPGDVCVHWLNHRCRYDADSCRYRHAIDALTPTQASAWVAGDPTGQQRKALGASGSRAGGTSGVNGSGAPNADARTQQGSSGSAAPPLSSHSGSMAASGSRGNAGGWAGWMAPPAHPHPAMAAANHGYFQDPVLLGSAVAPSGGGGGGVSGGGGPLALSHLSHHHHSPPSSIHDIHNSPPLPILSVPRPGSSASAAFHYGPELGRAVVDRHHGVRAEPQYLRQLREAFPNVSPTALLLALRRNRWDVRETGNTVLEMLAGAAQFLQEYEPASTLHGGSEATGDSPGLGASSSRSDTASRGSVPRVAISPTMMPAAGVIGSKAPSAKSGGSGGARSQSDDDDDNTNNHNGHSGSQAGALFGGDFALPSAAADVAAAHLTMYARSAGGGGFSFGAAPDGGDVPLETAERRSMLLSALCEIVPHADAASVERALETRGWNFADAFVDVSALQATRLAAAGLNSAWNHYGTTAESARAFGSGGEGTLGEKDDDGVNPALKLALPHKMKLDKLTAMFPDVEPALLLGALRATQFDLPTALDLASAMVDDQRLDVREALAEAKMQISSSNPTSPPQQLLRTGGGSNSLSPTASLSANTTTAGGPTGSAAGGSGGGSPGDGGAPDDLYIRAVMDIDTDVDWRRCREEAYLINAARLRTVRAAVSAYNAKDHSSGRTLMRRARELERRYHELNMLCMNALEREQDRTNGFGLLDLHGFHAREAVDVVHRRVALCREKRQSRLRIITGVGRHSRLPGRPTVLPAVAAHVNNVLAAKLRWCRGLRVDENRGVMDLEILL
jgi:DNA-nicking Smr family endonuclease